MGILDIRGKSVRRQRFFALSRLTTAWLALIMAVGLGVFSVWVMPVPEDKPDVVISLPSEPEKAVQFAEQPQAVSSSAQADANRPENSAALQEPIIAQAEAVTTQEELPDGALRIMISGEANEHTSRERTLAPPKEPLTALTATTKEGVVPRVSPDGRTPFDAYRRLPPPETGKPGVAVMLSGLGLDRALTEAAIENLPPEISLSFAPYAKDVAPLIAKAMAKGHEVAIELPMEGGGVAPDVLGPAGLLTTRSTEANHRRLDWLLARAPAYSMTTNYLGQVYSEDSASMAVLMAKLKAHGLGYVDDTGRAGQIAKSYGVPYARAIELVPPDGAVTRPSLDRLISQVGTEAVLAKVYISADAITAIEAWVKELDRKGLQLVPASAAVRGGA